MKKTQKIVIVIHFQLFYSANMLMLFLQKGRKYQKKQTKLHEKVKASAFEKRDRMLWNFT